MYPQKTLGKPPENFEMRLDSLHSAYELSKSVTLLFLSSARSKLVAKVPTGPEPTIAIRLA